MLKLNQVFLFLDSGLSDRELRRVAYKLNREEWSQLGTFLGVGDNDLLQLGGLSMGPQEKAFRLLCVWRTRCRLGRSQMISQLAVALEEVNRKDAAQFVLEQFMSGKPRKKLFGWWISREMRNTWTQSLDHLTVTWFYTNAWQNRNARKTLNISIFKFIL